MEGEVLSKVKGPVSTLWLVETLLGVVTFVEDTVSEASILNPIAPSL